MVKSLEINKVTGSIKLKPSGIGGSPLYIFMAVNKKKILYTYNLTALLQHTDVFSNLSIDNLSISHLLQCGVIPPPRTIYKKLFLLGIGDTANVTKTDGNLVIKFDHDFDYIEDNLKKQSNYKPDIDILLEKLANAIRSQADMNNKINLFHTAGKDSNMIALALHRHYKPEQLRFVCHQSEGETDESKTSKAIAKRLGIEHLTIRANLNLSKAYLTHLYEYFKNAPFPLLDNVTLAFPEYVMNYYDLGNSNIVIGDGNDTYMMSPPSLRDEIGIIINKHMNLEPISHLFNSEHPLVQVCRTPFEWARMSGFNNTDSQAIYNDFVSIKDYWIDMRDKYRLSSAIDIKSHSYACFIIYEVYIRKFRNYCTHINSNLIMPFFDPSVVGQILSYDQSLIVDTKKRKNKPIFREIIKKQLGVDCDAIGKKGYALNTVKFIFENTEWISEQVLNCSLWDKVSVELVINRLYSSTKSGGWKSSSAARLIYRLLLISLWYDNSKFINNAK